MGALTSKAEGCSEPDHRLVRSRQTWEASMIRRLDELKQSLLVADPRRIADSSGVVLAEAGLQLDYWDRKVEITWPELRAGYADGSPCSIFDTAMLMYYLTTADGSAMADRWIGFRELPGGAFYNQAFRGYSGDRIASAFSDDPHTLVDAASQLGGLRLPALSDYGFAFQPLPRVRLAAVFWLGDEEFPSRASVLFDAASPHYMITDGLALLGSGLAGRLIASQPRAG